MYASIVGADNAMQRAEIIAYWESDHTRRHPGYAYEMLMLTPEGEYFLAAQGGSRAEYAASLESGWLGRHRIHPLSAEAADDWLLQRGRTEDLERFLMGHDEEDWDLVDD
jgi:hypothetical protein